MTLLYDNAPRVAGAIMTLIILAYTFLPLRFYTRIKNKTWGTDDTCMAIATLPFSVLSVFCLGGAFNGIGVRNTRLSDDQHTIGMMYFFFFEVFYCVAIIPIKLSISFMLMRIASPMRQYVLSLYTISAMFTLMNLVAFFYIIFHCSPVKAAWQTVPGGSCQKAEILADIYYATTAVNIATDWFCALLPVPLLWSVQLNRNAKISVACLLGLGIFASLSACIRLHYTISLTMAEDYLFNVGDIVIWGYAENAIGLIVGCISTLRPLFRRMFQLGGSTADPSKPQWPTNDRRAYQECEGSYELPTTLRSDKVNALATVQARGSSSCDDSASEEHIMKDTSGIQISKTVLQEASYKSDDCPL